MFSPYDIYAYDLENSFIFSTDRPYIKKQSLKTINMNRLLSTRIAENRIAEIGYWLEMLKVIFQE